MASIRRRGTRWQARVTRRGYPAEAKTFPSRQLAEQWARSIEAEMDRGSYTSKSEAERTTLCEVLARYAREVTPQKKGGKDEAIRLQAMARTRLAAFSMAAVSPKEIARFRDERLREVCGATVVRDLALLSSVINHARREWGIAITNPAMMVRRPAAPPHRDRVLSHQDEERLLAALAPVGRKNPWLLPLVILALETAMRRGELLALRWEHVDVKRHVAHLPTTKTGRPRTVPLSLRAVRTLLEMPRSLDGRVFPISTTALRNAFERARRAAALVDLHFHDLRHTATTRLSERVPNVIELSAITGHEDVRMLARYYHPDPVRLAQRLG